MKGVVIMKENNLFKLDLDEPKENFEDAKKYLCGKEKPYNPKNTVNFYGFATTYVDRKLEKTSSQKVMFVKIARTFEKWDEEVKIYLDGKLTEESFNISDNTILVPMRLKDLEAPGKKETWRYIDLTMDVAILKLNELKAIQALNSKEAILQSPSISKLNKILLYTLWKKGSKLIIPTDLLYWSLYQISLACGRYAGLPIIWDSDIMKELVGGKRKGYIKAIPYSNLHEYNYKTEDFDCFPFELSIEGNRQILDRKQIASYFRQKILLLN